MRSFAVAVVMVFLMSLTVAHAEPGDADDGLDPRAAQMISLGVTALGLGYGAYHWQHADDALGGGAIATVALGIGPASGLWLAGESRRSTLGALARPGLIALGGTGIMAGWLIYAWSCGEERCNTGGQIGGVAIGSASAVFVALGIGWAARDLWKTPAILRRDRAPSFTLAPILGGDRAGLALTIVH